jgi:hypothetical protein
MVKTSAASYKLPECDPTRVNFIQFMRRIIAILAAVASCCAVDQWPTVAATGLTAHEQADGWILLFDGKTLHGWRGFKKPDPPKQGWVIEEGTLKHLAKGGGGDLMTDAEFDDFDLRWEWRITSGANSGLKYFVTENRNAAIGHEYQLIDDDRHVDAKIGEGKRITASFYDVLKPTATEVKPPGQWNESRVLVHKNHVEHWLNGKKVLSYELESEELKAAIAQSKFKSTAQFGTRVKGHILLQDHGDQMEFRNIKIRVLTP